MELAFCQGACVPRRTASCKVPCTMLHVLESCLTINHGPFTFPCMQHQLDLQRRLDDVWLAFRSAVLWKTSTSKAFALTRTHSQHSPSTLHCSA